MNHIEALQHVLATESDLEFAVLVGSRANGSASETSDWDIALRWREGLEPFAALQRTERLKQHISACSSIDPSRIDIIDLATARLAMRAVVAEDGRVLVGEDSLAWHHFLTRTWAEIEDFYWRKLHAA